MEVTDLLPGGHRWGEGEVSGPDLGDDLHHRPETRDTRVCGEIRTEVTRISQSHKLNIVFTTGAADTEH